MTAAKWNTQDAIAFCRLLESFAPEFGAHVALTGGCLYRDGQRKDVDILVYRIRQADRIDWRGFFERAATFGCHAGNDYGWNKKAFYLGKDVDFFDAEDDGEYGSYSPDTSERVTP